MVRIFVYGTLKEGFTLDGSCLEYRKEVTKDVEVDGTLFNLGSFPGIKLNTGHKVIGELHTFENSEEVLNIMDSIEGYNPGNEKQSLFIRKTITTNHDDEKIEAYAYEFNFDAYEIENDIIKTGIWEEN